MSVDKRKQKKNKKREDRLTKRKLAAKAQAGNELTSEQKSFGKVQIALVFVVAIVGAAVIILNS
ncbi:MAG: hypothetical protein GY909_18975 [Oligoflexia bacterium]|nr:hypothetical protein [Oligoflexia bacterium]